MKDRLDQSNFAQLPVRPRGARGQSSPLILLLLIGIGLATMTLYFLQLKGIMSAGDVAYRQGLWSQAEQAYLTALQKTAWLGDGRIQCSDGSLIFARSLLIEKIALVKSSQGQYEEAIPYFKQALEKNENWFKRCMKNRSNSEPLFNRYQPAEDVWRVLWNYSQVLMTLHREEEAKKLKQSVCPDLLSLCKNAHKLRLERILVGREAQMLLCEGCTSEGNALKKELAEIQELPRTQREDKLLPLLSTSVAPKSNPPFFDTLDLLPR